MRSFILLAPLLLAACATPQRPTPPPPRSNVPPAPPVVQQTGDLIGLSTNQLVARFGTPDLRIVEGSGVKLQFRIPLCVIDTYLYGDAVRHVDARDIYGRDVDRSTCIASMDRERR